MFASASASLASRVPVRLGERRGRSAAKVNTSARAATTYTLDGKGCAGARTGDTGEFKNNIVAYKKRDAPACPIKPIAVTELCASHEGGKFKMLDAIFEQVGDDLYIYGCKPDECVRDASLPRTARASSRQDDIDMAFPSAVSRGRINRPLPRAGLGLAETVFFRGSFFFSSLASVAPRLAPRPTPRRRRSPSSPPVRPPRPAPPVAPQHVRPPRPQGGRPPRPVHVVVETAPQARAARLPRRGVLHGIPQRRRARVRRERTAARAREESARGRTREEGRAREAASASRRTRGIPVSLRVLSVQYNTESLFACPGSRDRSTKRLSARVRGVPVVVIVDRLGAASSK